VLEVPQKKHPEDRELWVAEVQRFREMVEELSGVRVTAERLRETVALCNRKRKAMGRINEFRKRNDPPISGLDALLVAQLALNMDIDAFIAAAGELADELEDRTARGVSAYPDGGARVMMAGTPSPMGNAKVHHVVESSGLQVVVDESCTGLRYFRDLVDESPADLDGLIRAVADRYFKIDCPCFSPNTERLEALGPVVKEYNVQGVVQNILQFCHGFNIEAKAIEKVLTGAGIPSLKIVTDYSDEDAEQLRVRTESFAEILKAGGEACPVGTAPTKDG
jgi:benzoyl-CoA reductase/2-hydroxyglutaryl-CoA dehydratase subunit BcrC/BadD/HgdB